MSGQHIGSYDQIARLPNHPEHIADIDDMFSVVDTMTVNLVTILEQ